MFQTPEIRVLIFSENPGSLQTLRMLLWSGGVRRCRIASNLAQLLEGYVATEPTVALVHVASGNPTDAGLEMLGFLRRSKQSPNRRIPIVVVSQARDPETLGAVCSWGADGYVLMPASSDALMRHIETAQARKHAFIDLDAYVGPARPAAIRAHLHCDGRPCRNACEQCSRDNVAG